MNNNIILSYLKKEGIDIEDNGFWKSDLAVEFSTNLKKE